MLAVLLNVRSVDYRSRPMVGATYSARHGLQRICAMSKPTQSQQSDTGAARAYHIQLTIMAHSLRLATMDSGVDGDAKTVMKIGEISRVRRGSPVLPG